MPELTSPTRDLRLLTGINALYFAGIGVSSPLITLYLEELGADYTTIALILTSFVATILAASYGWGRLSDRLGRRKPLLVAGLLIVAGAYGWIFQAGSVGGVWLARLMEGVGVAAVASISLAMAGDLLESSRGKGGRMGWFRGLGSLAFALGAFSGGRFADRYSLAASMALCAALFGLAALLALPLRDRLVQTVESPNGTAETIGSPLRVPRNPLPAAFLAGVMLWMAAHAASTSVWPNYMASFGYSSTTISSLWGLAALVETPSMILAGILSDQVGRLAVLMSGGLAIAGVQMGYLFAVQLLPALLGVQLIRGYGFGAYTVAAMTFTAEQGTAGQRGSNSGIFNTAGSVGQLAGMLLGGTLAQRWGFGLMYSICAILAVGSAGCFFYLAIQQKKTRIVYEQTH